MAQTGKFNYRTATDGDLVALAVRATTAAFHQVEADGALNNPDGTDASLFSRFGDLTSGTFALFGTAAFGPDAQQFAVNVELVGGKLETVVSHGTDSSEAAAYYAESNLDPDDPRGWTGGVHLEVTELVGGKPMVIRLAGAASGVQGSLDAAFIRSLLSFLAAGMILRAKAQLAEAA